MGLVEVAYQLRRVSHQLKVFVAIRKEAFAKFDETTSMAQQYRGSTVDIALLAGEPARDLPQQHPPREGRATSSIPARLKTDPIERVPRHRRSSTTPSRGEPEDAFEYVCRHTLRRPRDFMTIGRKLSELSPEERRRETRSRKPYQAARRRSRANT